MFSTIHEAHKIKGIVGIKTYLYEIKRKTAATHVNGYRGAEYGLSEHLSFEFLDEFDMFAPAEAGCDECHS